MKAEYLKKIDKAIKDARTRDPESVLECAGFVPINPGYSVDGFVARKKQILFYGVSRQLKNKKYDFGVFHEGSHYWCTHLDLPGFLDKEGKHRDECGSFGLQYKVVASTEKDANIGAAHAIIETEPFLEMMGYDNEDVKAYIRDLDSFEVAVKDYEHHIYIARNNGSPDSRVKRMLAYRQKLAKMYDELEEQAQDLYCSGCLLSKSEIGRNFDVPEFVVDLKSEALSHLNYSLPSVELPRFDKVFKDW